MTYSDIQYGGEKSGCRAETGWKQRRHKKGLHTEASDSIQEPDWVVGSQILTNDE